MKNLILEISIIFKYMMILFVFLITFPQHVDAQKLFLPLLGGGYAEMGSNAPAPTVAPMTPMAPIQPSRGGLYGGSNYGPIQPMQPMQPINPTFSGGFGSWQ